MMTDDKKDKIEQQIINDMEDLVDNSHGGAVVDLLPMNTDENVAIGISVAVDALQDGNKKVARAALETVIEELDDPNC